MCWSTLSRMDWEKLEAGSEHLGFGGWVRRLSTGRAQPAREALSGLLNWDEHRLRNRTAAQ